MNIIEKMQDIIMNYDKISEFTNTDVHIDFTESNPTNYGLSPIGDTLKSETITGVQTRQHSFILYAVNQAMSDFDRLLNSSFLLELGRYLEHYDGDKTIDNGYITKLSCANAMMFDIPTTSINDGVRYQLQIYAEYIIESEE